MFFTDAHTAARYARKHSPWVNSTDPTFDESETRTPDNPIATVLAGRW